MGRSDMSISHGKRFVTTYGIITFPAENGENEGFTTLDSGYASMPTEPASKRDAELLPRPGSSTGALAAQISASGAIIPEDRHRTGTARTPPPSPELMSRAQAGSATATPALLRACVKSLTSQRAASARRCRHSSIAHSGLSAQSPISECAAPYVRLPSSALYTTVTMVEVRGLPAIVC